LWLDFTQFIMPRFSIFCQAPPGSAPGAL